MEDEGVWEGRGGRNTNITKHDSKLKRERHHRQHRRIHLTIPRDSIGIHDLLKGARELVCVEVRRWLLTGRNDVQNGRDKGATLLASGAEGELDALHGAGGAPALRECEERREGEKGEEVQKGREGEKGEVQRGREEKWRRNKERYLSNETLATEIVVELVHRVINGLLASHLVLPRHQLISDVTQHGTPLLRAAIEEELEIIETSERLVKEALTAGAGVGTGVDVGTE